MNGSVTFDTEGSGYDTIIAVSTGNTLATLSRMGQNYEILRPETLLPVGCLSTSRPA